MADLPEERMREGKASSNVGMDYFGPMNITLGHRRRSSTGKAYVTLFVCMAMKVIHMELVGSLPADHFSKLSKDS